MFTFNRPILHGKIGSSESLNQSNKENQRENKNELTGINNNVVVRDINNTIGERNIDDDDDVTQKCCKMEISDTTAIDETRSIDHIDENFNISNIKVTVGIDEDLQMILDLDPSIVDLGVDVIGCTPATISPTHTPKTLGIPGLPPIMGG